VQAPLKQAAFDPSFTRWPIPAKDRTPLTNESVLAVDAGSVESAVKPQIPQKPDAKVIKPIADKGFFGYM
jgi:hypothetical protein